MVFFVDIYTTKIIYKMKDRVVKFTDFNKLFEADPPAPAAAATPAPGAPAATPAPAAAPASDKPRSEERRVGKECRL